jgi:exo-poly-alpha-galacturonosidase
MNLRNKHFSTLFILALIFCFSSFTNKKQERYDITDFGALADTSVVNTEVIQAVIDQCAAEGGGTVVVPAGVFRSGALFFRQGVNLHIKQGGVMKGTVNEDDYPIVDTRWEGIERRWISAFINAFGLNGFKITGEGTIDGSGDEWLKYRDWRDLEAGRPRLIAVQNCKDVLLSGVSLKNQACWGLFVLYSEDVVIKDLTIRAAHNIPMSDGMDIDSSTDVYISDCDIDVNDDCIAIKSGKDEDGLRVNRPSRDIVVEKCIFRYGHGGVSMGSEMSGGIHDVEIRDCVMEADNWAPIRFKSQPSRGGVVENITYRDLVLKDTRQAFEFNMEWRMRPPLKPPSDPLPVVRNVQIINVSGTVAKVGLMHGLPESPIQNVSFTNCHIQAKEGFILENVEGLDLSGLHINVEEGEPIIRRNTR